MQAPDQQPDIAARIATVHERITAAARRAGRDPEEVTLVAVTKTQAPAVVAHAVAAGLHQLGENRVQEAQQKIMALASDHPHLHWHLIGHLQRNKARLAGNLFHMVHSLDSVRLAETLDHALQGRDSTTSSRRLPVLLQVNVSGEASKEGFDLPGGLEHPDRLPLFFAEVEQILALPNLQVQGLMTIAPLVDDPTTVRPVFRSLRLLRDGLARSFPTADWQHLSMGMTDDFEVAIEEGATIVRVGRAIFGERNT